MLTEVHAIVSNNRFVIRSIAYNPRVRFEERTVFKYCQQVRRIVTCYVAFGQPFRGIESMSTTVRVLLPRDIKAL